MNTKKYIAIAVIVVIAGLVIWMGINKDIDTSTSLENENQENTEVLEGEEQNENNAAGTQPAGQETPTENSDGQALIGGDAVVIVETPGTASYTLLGSNFMYDVTEMRVQEGDTVTVTFRSVDGFHDWVVDEFDATTSKVSTGEETSVTFIADKKGTFEYYCSVGSHRANGMVGTLIVE